MDQSIPTRKSALKNLLVKKAPKINVYEMQPGGELARKINHDKPHWPNPVTGSVVYFANSLNGLLERSSFH